MQVDVYYPKEGEEFIPLYQVKQPEFLWYCENPLADQPRLERKSLAEVNAIVSAKRGVQFNFFEGFLIPDTHKEDVVDTQFDFTQTLDKLYLGDMGEYGIGLFVREPLDAGAEIGLLGGKVITEEYNQKPSKGCVFHTVFADYNQQNILYTSEEYSGVLGFAQSSPEASIRGYLHEHAIESFERVPVKLGKFILHLLKLKEKKLPGSLLTFYYGKEYWMKILGDVRCDEVLFDPFGVPLDTRELAELYTKEFEVLKRELDAIGSKIPKNLDPMIFTTLVLEQFSKPLHHVTQALSKLPKEYLLKLNRDQQDILRLLEYFFKQYPRQGKLTDKNLALNNIGYMVPSVNYIQEGDHFALKGYSFFKCEQFHLAIRFWKEGYHRHLNWLKPNVKSINSSNVKVYLHPICGMFYWNVGNAFFKLGQKTEALFHLRLCLFIQENMQTPIMSNKTAADIRDRITQVEGLDSTELIDQCASVEYRG